METQKSSTAGRILIVPYFGSSQFDARQVVVRDVEQIKRGNQDDIEPNIRNLVFDCNTVSSIHASIFYKDGKVFVRDEKSKNGTFVNGKKLEAKKSGEGMEFFPGFIIGLGVQHTEQDIHSDAVPAGIICYVESVEIIDESNKVIKKLPFYQVDYFIGDIYKDKRTNVPTSTEDKINSCLVEINGMLNAIKDDSDEIENILEVYRRALSATNTRLSSFFSTYFVSRDTVEGINVLDLKYFGYEHDSGRTMDCCIVDRDLMMLSSLRTLIKRIINRIYEIISFIPPKSFKSLSIQIRNTPLRNYYLETFDEHKTLLNEFNNQSLQDVVKVMRSMSGELVDIVGLADVKLMFSEDHEKNTEGMIHKRNHMNPVQCEDLCGFRGVETYSNRLERQAKALRVINLVVGVSSSLIILVIVSLLYSNYLFIF